MSRGLLFLVLALGITLVAVPSARAGEAGTIFTLWPLVDYRSSPDDAYTSLNLLGPLGKWESSRRSTRLALRPLYYREASRDGTVIDEDVLFPVASRLHRGERDYFEFLRLLNVDVGSQGQGDDEINLFPLIFYGDKEEAGRYFAVFPLGGRLLRKFGRDSIDFALFPLYSRTVRAGTTTDNVLWPIFSLSRGERTFGWQFWPLYGQIEEEGVSAKRFALWPLVLSEESGLNTSEPRQHRLVFPFYESTDAPGFHSTGILWPFFTHVLDEDQGYEEWDFPWPLLRRTTGTARHGIRLFPLYTDETSGGIRTRLVLWPLYKIEEFRNEKLTQRRDRVCYFLFSHLQEQLGNGALPHKKRIALWPLFTYESKDGVGSFATLSLFEPFYPENERLARNLAPLWHLYQTRWDLQGNRASSFLWNLYWREERGADRAWELFPLLSYSGTVSSGSDVALLKGLLRYQRQATRRTVKLFYLPWGITWGALPPGS